jgi:ketosteroid isomerase-like protein
VTLRAPLAFLCICAWPAEAKETSMSSTWEQDIRAREEENRVAFLAADVAVLDLLWTDDFAVNSPLNLINDKQKTLALLRAGRIRHSSLTVEIEHMSRHEDTVVVMGSDRVTDPPDGTITHRRFTNLWRREGGAWRCFARHASVVRREPGLSS